MTAEQAVQQRLLTVQAELVAERLAHRKRPCRSAGKAAFEPEGGNRKAIPAEQARKLTQMPRSPAYVTTLLNR